MSKYQEALDDVKHIIINVLGMHRYEDAINILQELINARHVRAHEILKDTMLYGDSYYRVEDWLNKCLEGDVQDLPPFLESEYLVCAVRIEVRDYFDSLNISATDEDIENVVDEIFSSFSESVLNMDFIISECNKYLGNKNES